MRRGKVKSRLDTQFYVSNPDLPEGESFPKSYPSVLLEELSKRIIQPNEFIREYVSQSENSVALLRAANVLDGELNTEDLVFVDKEKLTSESFEDSYIQEGDILITRTGAKAGATCLVRELKREFIISSHSIRVIPQRISVNPKYLELFLLSRWGKAQITRLFTGAAQKQLQITTLSKLQIVLPSLEIQSALVEEMEQARESRRHKLTEANALLQSLDGWILDRLSITMPPADTRKVFAVRLGEVAKTSRLNSDYFHPERLLTIRAIEQLKNKLDIDPLFALVDFVRNLRKVSTGKYLGLANVQGNTGELVEVDEEVEGNCLAFEENDVLFARLRPYLNKVYRAEFSGVCSPEFHVLRVLDKERLHPDYLAVLLRSSLILAQTRYMMTGNTHPRLTNEDVVNLIIPIPEPGLQKTIAEEVQFRKTVARRLRAEAESEWQAERERFEVALLNGGTK